MWSRLVFTAVLVSSPAFAQVQAPKAPAAAKPAAAAAAAAKAAPAAAKAAPVAKAAVPAAAAAAAAPAAASPLDINSASKSELEALPGIGAAFADRIIKGRPYARKDQIKKILPAGVYEKVEALIVAKQLTR